jgi:periplasmic protein TonB
MPLLLIVMAIGREGRGATGSQVDSPSSRAPHEISELSLAVMWSYTLSLLPSAPRAPLWARLSEETEQTMPLWKAASIALALEALIPLMVFGIDWSKLAPPEPPPAIPVMSVKLEQPVQLEPTPPQPKPKPKEPEPIPRKKVKKRKNAIALEQPRPQPSDAAAKIQIPKPEPEPKPEPPKKIAPKPPPPPEPEAPPLPSVFRDVKPVKKVKPIYPREAEDQHIQGNVKVRLSVDVEGNVTDAQVLSADPPGVFDEAVLTAVRQYKFKKDGTSYQADQLVVFKLDD